MGHLAVKLAAFPLRRNWRLVFPVVPSLLAAYCLAGAWPVARAADPSVPEAYLPLRISPQLAGRTGEALLRFRALPTRPRVVDVVDWRCAIPRPVRCGRRPAPGGALGVAQAAWLPALDARGTVSRT